MRAFAEAYPDRTFVQQVAAQLLWFHNVTILTKVKDPTEREWYLLRHPQDGPTVGILLCKEKNRVVVEYALRDMSKPLGVAEYRLAQALPAELQSALPSVEELEAELAKLDERNLQEGNLQEEGYGG